MSDKIKPVEFGDKNESRAAIENLKRNMPFILENIALVAHMRKVAFDSHVEEGFTPDQALIIVQSMFHQ